MLHLLLYSVTIMVNSIRPNRDCHMTPQKTSVRWRFPFIVIWKPSSLSFLLNPEHHSSITVTREILSSQSQKFMDWVGVHTKHRARGEAGKWSKQEVHPLRSLWSILNLPTILSSVLWNIQTLHKQCIWGLLWKSQNVAKLICELAWALLTSLAPTHWFSLPVVRSLDGPALLRELVQESTSTICKRN